MKLLKISATILMLIVAVIPVFSQEYLDMSKQELEKLFVEGKDHVVLFESTDEGACVVQDKRDQRNMKHRITFSFTFEKECVAFYTINYPSNSFMEEEISMFLDMNEEKEALCDEQVEINGVEYNSRYDWDGDVLLEINKEDERMALTFSKL